MPCDISQAVLPTPMVMRQVLHGVHGTCTPPPPFVLPCNGASTFQTAMQPYSSSSFKTQDIKCN